MENGQLKAFVERIERLESEKADIASDIKDVYAEAKGNGFDVKALRAIIKMRKQDAEERREQEAIVETYAHALGMLADTELGQAALDRRRAELVMEPVRTGAKTLGEAAARVIPTVTIDMAKKCAECGTGGSAENGLCLACTGKAIGRKPMKSAAAHAVQKRFAADDGGIPPGLKRNPDNTLPTTA